MTNKSLVPIQPQIDLAKESGKHLLAISFPKSRSASYEAAVNVAQQATIYSEAMIGTQLFHYAVFDHAKEDISRALAILRYIGNIKGVQVYAGGKILQNTYDIQAVLECYMESQACKDWKAHCLQIVDYLVEENSQRYIFPCSYLRAWGSKLYLSHPASLENQINALAVKHGCDWCPHFNEKNFKKL